jgi:hypothetical protein
MHKTILAAAAALGLAAGASAQPPERWLYAGMQGGAMGWDASTVKRDPETGTLSAMRFFYFSQPQDGKKGDFSWVFQDIEFDCGANTFRLMDAAFFNKNRRGRADERGSDKALPLHENSPEWVLKKVLCDKAVLSGTAQATNMADAMDGAEKIALP